MAGGINLSNVRRGVAQAASVGYWMGQPYAGQGLMTDALRASGDVSMANAWLR